MLLITAGGPRGGGDIPSGIKTAVFTAEGTRRVSLDEVERVFILN